MGIYIQVHKSSADGDYHYDIYINGKHYDGGVIENNDDIPLSMTRLLEFIVATYPSSLNQDLIP